MIRTVVLAASAIALLAAAPAGAGAAEIRVKATGKAPAELRAEIVSAASRVCMEEVRGTGTATQLYASCVRDAVNKAAAQIRGS